MTDTIDLASAIAARIERMGDPAAGPSAGEVLVDTGGDWALLRATAQMPIAGLPSMPGVRQALDDILERFFPKPRTSPFPPQTIVGELQAAAFGPGLITAVDRFSQLNWPDRRFVLEALAKSSPTLGGMHYLSILQPQLDALPNVAVDVRAAWRAARRHWNAHEISADDLQAWFELMEDMLALPYDQMAEVLITLGVPAGHVEGIIADVVAELDAINFSWPTTMLMAGMVLPPAGWFDRLMTRLRGIDLNRTDFLEYVNPKKMPYAAFMGVAVHTAIAATYRVAHGPHTTAPGTGIWTNSSSVEQIFNFFRDQWGANHELSDLARSAALSRPDIFEFVMQHGQPPGWVYEIKHAGALGQGLITAEAEGLMYAAVLAVFGVPAVLGPAFEPGTTGVVPVPGGFAAFTSPIPGAIVYKIVKVPNEKYRQVYPGSAKTRAEDQKEMREALSAAAAAGAIVAAIGALHALAVILAELAVEYGWVVLFL